MHRPIASLGLKPALHKSILNHCEVKRKKPARKQANRGTPEIPVSSSSHRIVYKVYAAALIASREAARASASAAFFSG